MIVNGNEGGVQTTDISVESGKDIWLVINGPEDYTVSYEEPELAAETEAAAEEVTEAETAEESEAVEEAKEKSSPAGPIAAVVIVAAAGAGIGIAAKKKKAGK